MDVHDHFAIRERECREMSLAPDGAFADMCTEEEGSDGRRGIFWGHLVMPNDYYLDVFEYVVVDEHGAVHIEKYSYYLIHPEGFELWGYDKDPTHDPAIHGHVGPDHHRVPAHEISFKAMAEQAWETSSQEEEFKSG